MSTSVYSNTPKSVNTKSTNSTLSDRGVDLESGRYYARVGAEYRTFWSSLVRDQWFNAKIQEAK